MQGLVLHEHPTSAGESPSHLATSARVDATATAGAMTEALRGVLGEPAGGLDRQAEPAATFISCCVVGADQTGPSVTHAVTAICHEYRLSLPRWQWLRALAAFISVVASSTGAGGTVSSSCVHREEHGHRQEGHRVGSCPRCSVLTTALRTLCKIVIQATKVRQLRGHPAACARRIHVIMLHAEVPVKAGKGRAGTSDDAPKRRRRCCSAMLRHLLPPASKLLERTRGASTRHALERLAAPYCCS